MLTEEALEEARLANELHFVEDGEELMDYLYRRGKYTALSIAPFPGLILLDLNMPRKDGREALKEIKAEPALRRIPIVVLTTSRTEEDIYRTYDLGVSSFITKRFFNFFRLFFYKLLWIQLHANNTFRSTCASFLC